jgi:hypothetical protein
LPLSLVLADKVWTLAGPIIGALLGARWAIGSHRQKEWWNRRAEAYTNVLAAMETMERVARQLERHYETGTQEVASDPEFFDGLNEAMRDLQRATSLGTFYFSERAARDLKEMEAEVLAVEYNTLPPEVATAWLDIASRYIPRFSASAKADLMVDGGLARAQRLFQLARREH